jgi:hypothetical protein
VGGLEGVGWNWARFVLKRRSGWFVDSWISKMIVERWIIVRLAGNLWNSRHGHFSFFDSFWSVFLKQFIKLPSLWMKHLMNQTIFPYLLSPNTPPEVSTLSNVYYLQRDYISCILHDDDILKLLSITETVATLNNASRSKLKISSYGDVFFASLNTTLEDSRLNLRR